MSSATIAVKPTVPLPKLWSLGIAVVVLLAILFAP